MSAVHHVKNPILREEIIRCKQQNKLSDDAIKMFQKMADKYSRRYTYIYEQDREDCISFAVIDCWKYWRGYDPEISLNAFSYYTQIIHNAFSKSWRQLYGNFPKKNKISINSNSIYTI
jgi:DNA-directed RNA polymerase specialized sigma subunit